MKVIMSEVVQGRDIKGTLVHEGIEVSILEKGEEYEVGAVLGKWLVDNGKAKEVVKKVEVKPVVAEVPEQPQKRGER